jgi:predicted helicase
MDTVTTLRSVPPKAWQYQLGTYSALERVLERYKEREPRDPTIREKFNAYRLADYKERVIDLLQRVCTVSVGTMKIIVQDDGNSTQPRKGTGAKS